MAQRTQGKIAIFRDHPYPETAKSLIHLRKVDSVDPYDLEVASIFLARSGTEQEANAEFIVKAWNSHDALVAALQVFAQFADALDERVPDNVALAIFADGAVRFGPSGGATIGDLRKARAALAAAESA